MASSKDKFAILVDIPEDTNVEQQLVLPGVMKKHLSSNCREVMLVDGVGRKCTVLVFDDEHDCVRLGDSEWPAFARNNIIRYLGIKKLCFRKLGDDVFQVLCFNSTGKERIRSNSGALVMRSCLVQVSESTVDQQYIPCRILNGLNRKSKRKPIKKARLLGPKAHVDVHVDYKFDEGNPKYEKWQAVGFNGSEWSQFVVTNEIKLGYTVLFNYLEKRQFLVDVFTSDGVIAGTFEPEVTEDGEHM